MHNIGVKVFFASLDGAENLTNDVNNRVASVMNIIPLSVLGFSLIILIGLAGRALLQSHWLRGRFAKQSTPRIGYKQAFLRPWHDPSENIFQGVIGVGYGVVSSTQSVGFHAFRNFSDAANHPQKGNVILEVLLSGVIQDRALGYISTEQRVLQVIPEGCSICHGTPDFFVHRDGLSIYFLCRMHAGKDNLSKPKFLGRVIQFFSSEVDRVDAKPLNKLGEDFPTLATNHVVVAPKEGVNAFVPTQAL